MPFRCLLQILSSKRKSSLISAFKRQRAQLIGGFLVSVALPFVIRYMLSDVISPWDQLGTSMLVTLGLVISHVLNQEFTKYPFQDAVSSTLPAAVLGFSLVIGLILIGHLQYSRILLFSGFCATLCWYFLMSLIRYQLHRTSIAVVPAGNSHDLLSMSEIDWLEIDPTTTIPDLRGVAGIVVDLSSDLSKSWIDLLVSCASAGIPIYDSFKLRELITGQVALGHIGDIGLDALQPKKTYITIKSIVDLILAIALSPFLAAILLVCGIAIRLDSKGPIFFVQQRIGYRGRVFACYKLRTMHDNAEAFGPSYTRHRDRRITRVGRVLRTYRLDELPQFFNIIKGEMSWIGPRPEAIALAKTYEAGIDCYGFRHSVKPGLSGWAAIHQGNVAELDSAKVKLQYDFFYIKNISFTLDIFIAVKTIWVVFTGVGSK